MTEKDIIEKAVNNDTFLPKIYIDTALEYIEEYAKEGHPIEGNLKEAVKVLGWARAFLAEKNHEVVKDMERMIEEFHKLEEAKKQTE